MIHLSQRQTKSLWQRIDKNGPLPIFDPSLGPCWIWTGPLKNHGCGQLNVKGKNISAYLLVFQLLRGEVPEGLELDHLCRVRACCNPSHLEPVVHQINCLRSPLVHKTYCKRGHFLSEDSCYCYPRGVGIKRVCIACTEERDANRTRDRRIRA